MKQILITGGNGYIAKSLGDALQDTYDVTRINRSMFDLTAFEAMHDFFQGKYFDVVLHCAVQGGSRLKEDSYRDMDVNLTMYYNLLQHKPHYGKLIHFGSGAEDSDPDSPYGLSKRVIAKSISQVDGFYNLRIYNVFDHNELPTRFIKANIQRYINREPMVVFQDKFMDFFYMDDLISLVDYYINNKDLAKEAICNYNRVSTLTAIAQYINTMSDYEVPIEVRQQGQAKGYFDNGIRHTPSISYVGLQQGIKNVYKILKESK
jgi:nucleoside-diphosphate-sugar epimerase